MSVLLTDVAKCFGDHAAVDGVSVDIPEGAFFVVLGPSGCGKTTLLRLVAGLDMLDRGEVTLDGVMASGDGVHVPPEDREVGFVFQSYALWPHMNVLDNVAFPIESGGISRTAARQEAVSHLRTVALEAYRDRGPAELSGGQRQRVALARCLAGGARTVLMDEPLANLDPHLRASMEEELVRFHQRTGATTVYITHDQREAMALADLVAVMFEGRFAQVASPVEIYERPASEAVARFIGRSAILDGELTCADDVWRVELGPIRPIARVGSTPSEGAARIVVRPGDVSLSEDVRHSSVEGRVVSCSYRGGVWEGLVEIEGLAEPLPVASSRALQQDEAVFAAVESCWVLPAS